MKNEKNENIALIGGFVLIVIVVVFTIFRNSSFFNSNKSGVQQAGTLDEEKSTQLPYTTINATDLSKKMLISENKDGVALLDIRSFDLYITDHIVDAINIAIDEFPVDSRINANSLVVVIGENSSDKDITTAIEKLKKENFKNVLVLAGGMEAWRQLVGATVTYGNPKSFEDQSKVSYLNPEELADAIKQTVPVFIIDVRTKDEYASGHIEGSKNIPFEELEKRRGEISEKRVVVVGASELQEFQAAVQMHDMVLVSPFVMRTAMPGWQSKNFALVK
jgi:rhodanese-related sulfurtransferase